MLTITVDDTNRQITVIQAAARELGKNDRPSPDRKLSDSAREQMRQRLKQEG